LRADVLVDVVNTAAVDGELLSEVKSYVDEQALS
jgi:hypothetical protein